MAKSKKIISVILSVAMCTGIVCAATANAEKTTPKSEQTVAQTMTKEELHLEVNRRFFDENENLLQISDDLGITPYECLPPIPDSTEMSETERQKAVEKRLQIEAALSKEVHRRMFDNDEDLIKIANDLGIPVYENLPPVSIDWESEKLQEQGSEKIVIDSFPSKLGDLPLITAFSDLYTGYASYTQNYFDPDSNTISVDYTFSGTPFETNERRVQVRLYRQRKSYAGSKDWEFVKKYDVTFFGSVSTSCIFNNLSDDYVYCLGFTNVSNESNAGSTKIDGQVYISNSYD